MKCFEKIIRQRLLSYTCNHADPHQFAYKPNRSTDDATLSLLHNAFRHLDNTGSFVRILFVDFSSAFNNTIQPHLLALKLLSLDVNPRLILWIVDFLTNRSQSVRFHSAISAPRHTSTGAPQGTVLSPVLFTLYTNDCKGNETTPLIKYSDDTALEDLSNSDSHYFTEVDRFVTWCDDNYLDLNVTKTKELVIDFRTQPQTIPDLTINGQKVERVTDYKYLGTVIDNKLTFKSNTDAIHKKCQSRVYCLQKLRSLGVNGKVLQNFYHCFIESVLTFGIVCWYGSLSVKCKNVLNKVVKVCGKVVGKGQTSMSELYECRMVKKAGKIASDSSHVLSQHYELLPSGRRYRTFKCKARAQRSFVPTSVQLLNKKR